MQRREPPGTEEGWYALHDLRRIDWDAWRAAPERERERAVEEGIEHLEEHLAVADSEAGGSALFSVVGHKADLMMLHLRPTLAAVERAERRFESTAFAKFTERASSYVSVTEVSGYMHEDLTEGLEDIEDAGMRNYMKQRIYPEIPDAEHVCFYPMDKRRDPEYNWYDLPFEERAEYMSAHGEIGREYAGKVSQIITGSVGFDDYEWGVTLFADDPTDIKHLLYEMRFDPSSSRFAEFGPFYVGRRFPPADLPAFLTGESVPVEENEEAKSNGAGTERDRHPDGNKSGSDSSSPGRPDVSAEHEEVDAETLRGELRRFGIDTDEHPEASYGLIFESDADAGMLTEDVEGLRGNFDHYDTHVLTAVRADGGRPAVLSLWRNERAANTASGFLADLPGVSEGIGAQLNGDGDGSEEDDSSKAPGTNGDEDIRGELEELGIYAGKPHGEDVHALVLYSEADAEAVAAELEDLAGHFDRYDTHVKSAVYANEGDGDEVAVVSLWETADAAETAADHLAELPGVVGRAREIGEGFGTMGMFYTVEPEHRESFIDTFGEVEGLLSEMDGHIETNLMTNLDEPEDMFIASRWRSREDAMEFFRSEEFRETVRFGREVLADRPRHVFLA